MNFSFSKSHIMILAMMGFLLLSAIALVYVKDSYRILTSDLQKTQIKSEQLHVTWSQLLLEKSTWTASARVQAIAENALNMVMPKKIILVQQ